MMLYSYPSWGKTSVVGTSAEAGRTLLVHSSMDLMPSRVLNQPGLDEVVCDTHEEMDDVLDYCRMTQDFPYLWVWWDCISIAQDVLLDAVWEATLAFSPHRRVKSIRGGLDRPEYGTNAEHIQRWVRYMVGAKRFHFGITAHPAEVDHPSNDQGGTILAPWIQVRQMPNKICGYMNMVGFMDLMESKDQKWRRLHFQENSRFYAKDQYDAFLPRGFLDVRQGERGTIPKIMAAVEAARSGGATTASRGKGRGARREQ
jgi:hypothetical protein